MSIVFNNTTYNLNVEVRFFMCPYMHFKVPSTKISSPTTLDLRNCLTPVRDQGTDGNSAIFASITMAEYNLKKYCIYNDWLSTWFFHQNYMYLNIPFTGYQPRYRTPEECNKKIIIVNVLAAMNMLPEAAIINKFNCKDNYQYFQAIDWRNNNYNSNIKNIQTLLSSNYPKYNTKNGDGIHSYCSLHSIDDIKIALTNYGPCIIGVDLYNNSSELWKPKNNEKVLGGHVLAIVGYDNNSFIVRNSWGTSWGNKGYSNLLFNDFRYIICAYTFTYDIDFNNTYLKCIENKSTDSINTISIIIFSLIGLFILSLFIYYIFYKQLYKLSFYNLTFYYGRYISEIIFCLLLIISTMIMYNFNGLNNIFIVNITILVIYFIGILFNLILKTI